jgi:hypothetical protein
MRGIFMGDKHENKNKHAKKKLTTKEKKAMNHLKLIEGSKNKQGTPVAVDTNQFKDKKAA